MPAARAAASTSASVAPGSPQAEVVGHRRPQEQRVLEHEADQPGQLRRRHLPQVDPAEGDPPLGRVGEAGQQAGDGRLPRARRPHQGRHRPRLQHQVDAGHRRPRPVVGEADALVADDRARRGPGLHRFRQGGRVEQGPHPGRRRPRHLQLVGGVAQADDRARQPDPEHREREQVQRSQPALAHEHRAQAEHPGQAGEGRRHDLGRRRQPQEPPHPRPEGGREPVGGLGEAGVGPSRLARRP